MVGEVVTLGVVGRVDCSPSHAPGRRGESSKKMSQISSKWPVTLERLRGIIGTAQGREGMELGPPALEGCLQALESFCRCPRIPGPTGRVLMLGGTMADFENGDIIRIAASLIYDLTEELVNVYHLRINDGGPFSWASMAPGLQDYMDGVMTTLDTELSTLISAGLLSVSNVTQSTVFGAIAWGAFSAGGAAGEPTAAGVTCFAFARTRKPRVQIRKYYGVFPQAAMVDGVWDAGVTGACGDSMDYHIAEQNPFAACDIQGVAYNRTLLTWEYGVTVSTNGEPSYQRRRRRGVGS